MNSKITIGVTGSIGSGKSIVCRIIQTMGYPVFYSDDQAKNILSNHPEVVREVKSLLGDESYSGNLPNRPFIAEKIFSDNGLIQQLNSIIHPRVREAFKTWSESQNAKLVFNEAAILFETGAYKNFNYTILVTAPQDLRISRVIKRDGTSEQEVRSRMQNQWPDDKKIDLASFFIQNDEKELVIPQVLNILQKIESNDNL